MYRIAKFEKVSFEQYLKDMRKELSAEGIYIKDEEDFVSIIEKLRYN